MQFVEELAQFLFIPNLSDSVGKKCAYILMR